HRCTGPGSLSVPISKLVTWPPVDKVGEGIDDSDEVVSAARERDKYSDQSDECGAHRDGEGWVRSISRDYDYGNRREGEVDDVSEQIEQGKYQVSNAHNPGVCGLIQNLGAGRLRTRVTTWARMMFLSGKRTVIRGAWWVNRRG